MQSENEHCDDRHGEIERKKKEKNDGGLAGCKTANEVKSDLWCHKIAVISRHITKLHLTIPFNLLSVS